MARSEDVWQKIKGFFEKAWGYIAAFAGGVAAMLLIGRSRESRAQSHIDELRDKLQEYTNLVRTAGHANQRLAKQLESLTARYNTLRARTEQCNGDARELDRINGDIGDELQELGGAIAELREFIERHGRPGQNI